MKKLMPAMSWFLRDLFQSVKILKFYRTV